MKKYKFMIGTEFTVLAKNEEDALQKAEEYELKSYELVPLFLPEN